MIKAGPENNYLPDPAKKLFLKKERLFFLTGCRPRATRRKRLSLSFTTVVKQQNHFNHEPVSIPEISEKEKKQRN